MLKIDLDKLANQVDAQTKPPVHLWQPELSGDIDILIKADGSWWHEGVQMQRLALVKLFASILKREGDEYFLVTPVEKWRLQVEDMPFVAAALLSEHDRISVITNTEEKVLVDSAQPLCLSSAEGDLERPYIAMDNGLHIRIGRNVYYQLVEMAELVENADGRQQAFVNSAGERFSLGCFEA